MKMTISVLGRFHAFELASQLARQDALDRLITSYPASFAAAHGVPSPLVAGLPWYEATIRAGRRAGLGTRLDRYVAASYDRAAARRLPSEVDVFLGWSGSCERSLERAKNAGAITMVNRSSAHIETQRDLLQREAAQLGTGGHIPSAWVVDRELLEYDAADYVVVPSSFARQTFVDRGFPENKLLTVPLGVDVDRFRPLPRSDDTFRIVHAGTSSLRKGVHHLLQAFAELHLPAAELWLVGSVAPEMEPFFRRYAGTFRHIQPVPQAELPSIYTQCSALALCSLDDGFGLVLPQAMACGLPIICTTSTGGPDLIREGREGLLIPPGDVAAIKQAILTLYEDRERLADMGRAARTRSVMGFTWERVTESLMSQIAGKINVRRELKAGMGVAGACT